MSFHSLKDLMPKAAGKFQLQGELQAAMVINRASALVKELFSESLERHIRPKRFKQGVLWIAVDNAIAGQEVQMKRYSLKETLNAGFDKALVQEIRSFQETLSPDDGY